MNSQFLKEVAKILTFVAGAGVLYWFGKKLEGSWVELIFFK